jgi:hypothetical protein
MFYTTGTNQRWFLEGSQALYHPHLLPTMDKFHRQLRSPPLPTCGVYTKLPLVATGQLQKYMPICAILQFQGTPIPTSTGAPNSGGVFPDRVLAGHAPFPMCRCVGKFFFTHVGQKWFLPVNDESFKVMVELNVSNIDKIQLCRWMHWGQAVTGLAT